jgi:hypothetical protein
LHTHTKYVAQIKYLYELVLWILNNRKAYINRTYISYIANNTYKQPWLVSKCNYSSQKSLLTTGIWTRDLWIRSQITYAYIIIYTYHIIIQNTYISNINPKNFWYEKYCIHDRWIAHHRLITIRRRTLVAFYDIHGRDYRSERKETAHL